MKEVWKDVPGYEGLYQVSNLGRVKSLPKKGGWSQAKILRPRYDRNGYNRVGLYKNGKSNEAKVHRLVATVFLGKAPEGKTTINHKDGNHSNNCVDNLEWASQLENNLHSIHILKNRYVPVARYSMDGHIIKEYESVTAAAQDVHAEKTNIVKACNGFPNRTCAGFVWGYINGHHKRRIIC